MIVFLTIFIGMSLFTFMIAWVETKKILENEEKWIKELVGHAHLVYPPSPPIKTALGKFRPDLKAPLHRTIFKY
jgi:hypothetical protein